MVSVNSLPWMKSRSKADTSVSSQSDVSVRCGRPPGTMWEQERRPPGSDVPGVVPAVHFGGNPLDRASFQGGFVFVFHG